MNFYRKFIHGAALILCPLTDALRGDPEAFPWSPQMDTAFVYPKSALALVPTLVHPALQHKFLWMLVLQTLRWELFFSS